jgi:hypothetical protein
MSVALKALRIGGAISGSDATSGSQQQVTHQRLAAELTGPQSDSLEVNNADQLHNEQLTRSETTNGCDRK